MQKVFLFLLAIICLTTAVVVVFFDPLKRHNRAGLRVETPRGAAQIFLNEQYLGLSPLLKEDLQAGDYLLKIIPQDNEDSKFTIPIHLERGTLAVAVFNAGDSIKKSSSTIFELFAQDNPSSSVSFESYPENALLSFNGNRSDFTPLIVEELTAGEHHFTVNLPSYEAQDHSFYTLKGYQTKVTINLAKLPVITEEKSPPSSASAVISERYQAELASQSASTSSTSGDFAKIE